MVQSPSWEANWFTASQEFPHILWNPKVHYHTHKRPPPISILGLPNPVLIPTSYLLEIHPNIIHPSAPRPLQWSPSLRLPHQDPIHPPLLTHRCHMPSPSHSSRLALGNLIHSHVTVIVYKPPVVLHYSRPNKTIFGMTTCVNRGWIIMIYSHQLCT